MTPAYLFRVLAIILIALPAFSVEPLIKDPTLLELLRQLEGASSAKPVDANLVDGLKERLAELRRQLYGEEGVIVETNGKKFFFLKHDVAILSPTLENAMEALGVSGPIPFLQIEPRSFSIVAKVLQYLHEKKAENALRASLKASLQKISKEDARDIVNAGHFFELPLVHEEAVAVYANHILVNDIDSLSQMNAQAYAAYSNAFLDSVPGLVQNLHLQAQRLQNQPHQMQNWERVQAQMEKWLVPQAEPIAVFRHPIKTPIHGIAFGADGQAVITASFDGNARLWKMEKGVFDKPTLVFPHGSPLLSLALSSDGKTLATGARDGTVKLWDYTQKPGWVLNPSPLVTLETQREEVTGLVFSPDGKFLYVASTEKNGGSLMTFARGKDGTFMAKPVWDINLTPTKWRYTQSRRIALSQNGKYLAVSGNPSVVYSTNDQGDLHQFATYMGIPKGAAFSVAFGGTTLMLGMEKNLNFFPLSRGDAHSLLRAYPIHASVHCAALSPSADMLATGSVGIQIFDKDNFQPPNDMNQNPATFFHFPEDVFSLAFNNDGRLLVAGASNGEAVVFPAREKLDLTQLNFAQLQVINWALKNHVTQADEVPLHLRAALNEYAEKYLFGASEKSKRRKVGNE